MVAYSFKQQFIAPILSGIKRQTIRANRKRHAHLGEELQLYTGMRTKYCTLIGRATCSDVDVVQMDFCRGVVWINLSPVTNLDLFARADGFDCWERMEAFWKQTHGTGEFDGQLIRWHRFRAH